MPETRFNIISEQGDGAGFACRLKDEGYEVRLWIRDPDGASIMDNMVSKVGDLEDLIHDAELGRDIYLSDVTGNGITLDYLRNTGYPVLGGSMFADRLERDRDLGYSVMADAGIEIPETESFRNFDEAIAFVEANGDTRWVYKPSKQLGDLSPSHVSYDRDDLVQMLQNIAKEVDIAHPEFSLQAFEEGVALSTELWFQNGELIDLMTNHTIERKELMCDDIGPSGGCVGNITWFCGGCKACAVAKQLVPWANRVSYHGMLDLNAIVSRGRIYGLEFTPRFGYDATPTLLFELVRGGLGNFLEAFARGEVNRLDLKDGFAGGVRVTIPPWPSEKYDADEGVPIRGLTEKQISEAYWYNVKKDSEGNLVSAGAWGVIAIITAFSTDPGRAVAKPLDTLKALKLKNKQYRTDLHRVFVEDMRKLEALGIEINAYQEA